MAKTEAMLRRPKVGIEEFVELADLRDLIVIEDVAQACSAEYHGKHCGTNYRMSKVEGAVNLVQLRKAAPAG